MATSLDLQEQEQIDALKAFWKSYGNLITWLLIAALGSYAAWNGWRWYQRDQGMKAGAMFDELERAAQSGEAERVARIFGDLRQRFPRTAHAAQGGLLAARVQFEKGQADAARSSLTWVAEESGLEELRTVARLRLAGLLLDAGQPAEALAQLDKASGDEFAGLVADRRGDILAAQGKAAEAKTAYEAAFKALPDTVEYRRLIEAKLTAMGAAPATAASGAAR